MALVKVDCTAGGKESCNKYSVSGYPTLKIFRNGEFSQEYNGPREAPGKVFSIYSSAYFHLFAFVSVCPLPKVLDLATLKKFTHVAVSNLLLTINFNQ